MKCQVALVLMLAYFTAAYQCPYRLTVPVTKVFEANLDTGYTYVRGGYGISWVTPLTGPVSGACSRQGVIKITYPAPQSRQQRRCFKFDFHFSSPSGWNFNIGDSTTNGYGETSNAAEVHNVGGSFYVYSKNIDSYGSRGILVENRAGVVTGQVSVTIGDEFVKYESNSWNKCYVSRRYLFPLNGQDDLVDYDIFFSMNRVIRYRSDRTGTGLCKAIITAMDCPQLTGDGGLGGLDPALG